MQKPSTEIKAQHHCEIIVCNCCSSGFLLAGADPDVYKFEVMAVIHVMALVKMKERNLRSFISCFTQSVVSALNSAKPPHRLLNHLH